MEFKAEREVDAESPGAVTQGTVIAEREACGTDDQSKADDQLKKSTGMEITLRDYDVRGEKSIAIAQAGICCFVLVLHLVAQYSSHLQSVNPWVLIILGALIASSFLRFMAARTKPLREWSLEIFNIVDVAIFLSLIWSYQIAYDHAASGVLKSPSMTLLFVLIALRALRLHPVPLLITGATAFAGWGVIAVLAALKGGSGAITQDYVQYLTSHDILIGAEVEKLVAIAALTLFLVMATYKARKLLSKATDAADYAEALDSAKRNLERAEKEKDSAEKTLRKLDRQEKKLAEKNRLFNAALDNMTQGLCMFDGNKRLLVCNELYIQMYELSPHLSRPGTPFRSIIEHRIDRGIFAGSDPEEYIQERFAAVEEKEVSTKIQELANGRTIAISHQPMEDGGWVATHQDITDLRRFEAEVNHLVNHDTLTGLPNRTMLRMRLDVALQHLGQGEDVAVMSLGIDRFKAVNDTLGHPVGDKLLKLVAKRLNSCVRDCDTVARLGSDEFGIVQVGAIQPEDVTILARRICDIIKRPFDIDGQEVVVGASIGISIAPADGVEPHLLLKNAGMALYDAKRHASGSFRFFETGMDSDLNSRRKMDIDLRKALELGQFELHYQPLQNLETGDISGLEALLRRRHPERGFVPPAEFIPLAEEIGLIVPLGEWVIRQSCADASLWPDNIKIAVNVSPVQFRKGNIVPIVMSALGASEIDPRRLELEITESVLLNKSESTLSILHQLRSLGVRIAMDDFGTGYSSLSYLRSFPFDKIKIDGSFIQDLSNSEDALAIVRAVASLGKSLGMTTTAECVETVEQRDYVVKEGYTEIQGYFFSPPLSAEEISEQFFSAKKQAAGSAAVRTLVPDLITGTG